MTQARRTDVKTKSSALILAAAMVCLTAACSPGKPGLVNGLDPEKERSANFYSEDPGPQSEDPVRAQLGSLFLVEHFSVRNNPTMITAIQEHQPGGIVFWNPDNADSSVIRSVIRTYSETSKLAGHLPILFSADYEGGQLPLAPSGKNIAGIQRFKKGFTDLAHPIWLGKSLNQTKSDELCRLHAKIMARELKSVGVNYPLTVTSDLAMRLFNNRGISQKPLEVAICLKAMMEVFAAEKDIIFVTKHFPGLGQTKGDTHEQVAKSTAETLEEANSHLLPFEQIIRTVNAKGSWKQYSILASHALFPLYDPSAITTESPKILRGLLREKLKFQGILVSDAMWMGSYGKLADEQLMPTYLKAFVSGMDMLMIPGSKFAASIAYFRAVYDGTLSDEQKTVLEEITGKPAVEIQKNFLERLKESLNNINRVRSTMTASVDMMAKEDVAPSEGTATERARYYELLSATNEAWSGRLPTPLKEAN